MHLTILFLHPRSSNLQTVSSNVTSSDAYVVLVKQLFFRPFPEQLFFPRSFSFSPEQLFLRPPSSVTAFLSPPISFSFAPPVKILGMLSGCFPCAVCVLSGLLILLLCFRFRCCGAAFTDLLLLSLLCCWFCCFRCFAAVFAALLLFFSVAFAAVFAALLLLLLLCSCSSCFASSFVALALLLLVLLLLCYCFCFYAAVIAAFAAVVLLCCCCCCFCCCAGAFAAAFTAFVSLLLVLVLSLLCSCFCCFVADFSAV